MLHGPNLNLLGTREPSLYGTASLIELNARLADVATEVGMELSFAQSNLEGELITWLQAAGAGDADGVVLNAGGYAHTSIAIADAVRAIAPLPVVEVHLTNTAARGPERQRALVGAACAGRVEGLGALSYEVALYALQRILTR